MIKVKNGSIKKPKHEKKREEERKLCKKLGIRSFTYKVHKEALAKKNGKTIKK